MRLYLPLSALCFVVILCACSTKTPAATSAESPTETRVPFEKYEVFVATDILNVRKAPDTDSPVLGKAHTNDVLTVVSDQEKKSTVSGLEGTWLEIESYEYNGFVFSPYVQKFDRDKIKPVLYPKSTNKFETQSFDNSYEKAKFLEKQILPSLLGKVDRQDQMLTIKCSNGKVLSFANVISDEKKPRYSVVDIVNDEYLILETQYYEGVDDSLLNLITGELSGLLSASYVLDPSKKFLCNFATADEDVPPGLQIIDLETQKVQFHDKEESIYGARWLPDGSIEIAGNGGQRRNNVQYYFKMIVSRVDGKWLMNSAKTQI